MQLIDKITSFLSAPIGIIKSWIAGHQLPSVAILLAVLVFLAYGQTLQMYFWKDDSALMFKAQHPQEDAGFWGKGIFGEGPYRHIAEPFVVLYPIFGLEPTGYFAVGLIFYLLAAFSVYFLALALFKKKLPGLLAASLFAAGYIASDSVYGLTNSLQTSRGIVMLSWLVIFFVTYLRQKRFLLYIISLILFFFTLDTVFIRSHGLIFVLLAADVFFTYKGLSRKWLSSLFWRQLPFWLIFYKLYLETNQHSLSAGQSLAGLLQGDLTPVISLLVSFGNLLIPEVYLQQLDKLFNVGSAQPLAEIISGVMFVGILIAAVVIFRLKKQGENIRLLLFCIVWIFGNVVLYFAFDAKQVLGSTHRYYTYSAVGFALLVSLLSYNFTQLFLRQSLLKTLLPIIIVGCFILNYLVIERGIQQSIIAKQAQPARLFFKTLKTAVPHLPKGAMVYFDVANSPQVQNQFDQFFGAGSMPESTVIAIYYYLDRYDLTLTYSFYDIVKKLQDKTITLDKIYTFYYDGDKLHDTTDSVRQGLVTPKSVILPITSIGANVPIDLGVNAHVSTQLARVGDKTIGKNPEITITFDKQVPSVTPQTLQVNMAISTKSLSDVPLPYQDGKGSQVVNVGDTKLTFAYLMNQSEYLRTVSVGATTSWQDQIPANLADGRIETSWMANRVSWNNWVHDDKQQEQSIVLDLGQVKNISKIIWTNGNAVRTPTGYTITTSTNQDDWQIAKIISTGPARATNAVWQDDFSPRWARFIKINITQSSGGDSPQVAELAVVDEQFRNVDWAGASQLMKVPFSIISNPAQWYQAIGYISQNGTARLRWKKDKDSGWDAANYQYFPIFIDGQFHTYQLTIPAGGLYLDQVMIDNLNFPSTVFIQPVRIVKATGI